MQKEKDYFVFQLKKDISDLFKSQLGDLEDLREEHLEMLRKLQDALPVDFLPVLLASDYFSDDKFSWLRKRILDKGNGVLRSVEDQINKFEITIAPPTPEVVNFEELVNWLHTIKKDNEKINKSN